MSISLKKTQRIDTIPGEVEEDDLQYEYEVYEFSQDDVTLFVTCYLDNGNVAYINGWARSSPPSATDRQIPELVTNFLANGLDVKEINKSDFNHPLILQALKILKQEGKTRVEYVTHESDSGKSLLWIQGETPGTDMNRLPFLGVE